MPRNLSKLKQWETLHKPELNIKITAQIRQRGINNTKGGTNGQT